MSSTSEAEYANWTPEELMRDYDGEIKRDILVRCLEWYSTTEVQEKINANRIDGKIVQYANLYVEIKRDIEAIALRDGHLPTDYRLQWDKRRIANLEARFGADHLTVKLMRQHVPVREDEDGTAPTLSFHPGPEELEAARPENRKTKTLQTETADYWYKFLAATETHGVLRMRSAYGMAACTFHEELNKGKRIVKRMDEIAEIEARGGSIQQTYFPSPPLQPGQQIYAFVPETPFVVPRNRPYRYRPKGGKAKPMAKGKSPAATTPATTLKKTTLKKTTLKRTTLQTLKTSTLKAPTPNATTLKKKPTPARKPLLSPHMKQTLSYLRNQLLANPSADPSLDTLATRFDHPLFCADQTLQERQKFESCETGMTIEHWLDWCDSKGDSIVEQHGKARVATSLALCIRLWLEQVRCEEHAGAEFPEESFLCYAAGRLEDLEGIDEEVEEGLRRYDEDAAEAQKEQRIEMSCW